MTVSRFFVAAGSLAAAAAVLLGAFGAHGLRGRLAQDMMAVYQTAVHYHLLHAVGLIVVGVLAGIRPHVPALRWAGGLLLAGIVLFSGSLYALALTQVRWLGAVTPFGGMAFILGWLALAAGSFSRHY